MLSGTTPFFESAVSESSGFTESTTKTVTFTEHSSHAVKAFLEYCYTGKYTFEDGYKGMVTPVLDFEVYQLGDYALAEDVKSYAAKMMKWWLSDIGGSKASLLPELVRVLYGAEGDHTEMKEIVVEAVVRELGTKGVEFMAPLSDTMKDYGEFSTSILEKSLRGGMCSAEATMTGSCRDCNNPNTHQLRMTEGDKTMDITCPYCSYGGFLRCTILPKKWA